MAAISGEVGGEGEAEPAKAGQERAAGRVCGSRAANIGAAVSATKVEIIDVVGFNIVDIAGAESAGSQRVQPRRRA